MNLRSADNSKSRFAAYVEGLVSVIGHADRAMALVEIIRRGVDCLSSNRDGPEVVFLGLEVDSANHIGRFAGQNL